MALTWNVWNIAATTDLRKMMNNFINGICRNYSTNFFEVKHNSKCIIIDDLNSKSVLVS